MTTTHDTTGLREQIARVICERGGTSWDFYAQEAPLMAEGLREVADAILAHLTAEGLLGAGWRAILYLRPEGDNFDQWRKHASRSELYQRGDTVLVWINEADLFLGPLVPCLAPPQVAQAEGEGS